MFKSENHKKQTDLILDLLGEKPFDLADDVYYRSFAYVAGAVNKFNEIKETINLDGIDLDQLYEEMERFSSSEKAMTRFAIQCFNGRLDDITLPQVMHSLDSENSNGIKEAIGIRY
ncbi:hypothetical protein ACQKEX_14570 [Bacillus pumilus]|uniref:hypothetical protein n=1 Tax=Bacillus TaxID=1386 RepID=UPI003D09002E